jgi:hypothetical protein
MILRLLLALALGHASAAPLERLRNNGALFVRGEDRMPLRCLESAGLMDKDSASQDQELDRAAAAGFNSVSFEAPMMGSGGFCQKLGALDSSRVAAFKALLAKMEGKRLYAFPVLWNASSIAAFEKVGGGEAKFFRGKIQNQWQSWLLRELLRGQGSELSLSSTAAVGGWILYRGPWPGPKRRGEELSDAGGAQAFTAPLRSWLLVQLRSLRQGGALQMAGADLLLKGDLGAQVSVEDPSLSPSAGTVPVAELRQQETSLDTSDAMDTLPPLPGQEKVTGEAVAGPALTPWDLEGVDWDSVARALREIPVSTGLDFMQLTLDTQDWYRVGDAMATASEKDRQAPFVWRHDWRDASRYERQKRLEPPEGLAGLMGPWPDNDWPDSGESIWPSEGKSDSLSRALAFKYMEVLSKEGKPVLALHLNKPSQVFLTWGKLWPPTKASASTDPALVHELVLKGAHFGDNILFYAVARSKRWGGASLRCRWLKLVAPPPSGKAKAGHPKAGGEGP